MKYFIRTLKESDITAIIAGEEDVFGSSMGYDFLYTELTLNPYAFYFVIDVNKKFAGYIGLWIYETRAEIVNFFIMKKYQGYGFGYDLLDFALEVCKKAGVSNISLEVREDNERAINLYKKCGFEYSHIRENYYSDSTDALVFIKRLR